MTKTKTKTKTKTILTLATLATLTTAALAPTSASAYTYHPGSAGQWSDHAIKSYGGHPYWYRPVHYGYHPTYRPAYYPSYYPTYSYPVYQTPVSDAAPAYQPAQPASQPAEPAAAQPEVNGTNVATVAVPDGQYSMSGEGQ